MFHQDHAGIPGSKWNSCSFGEVKGVMIAVFSMPALAITGAVPMTLFVFVITSRIDHILIAL